MCVFFACLSIAPKTANWYNSRIMNINKINPSTLKITDMRFADIDGTPKRCTLMKLYTNQGLVGYGEVRDASSRTYAAMLKSRIIGENPCNVEKIFRRIKQFGGDSRQAGGVCAVELACWGTSPQTCGEDRRDNTVFPARDMRTAFCRGGYASPGRAFSDTPPIFPCRRGLP